MQIVDSHVHYWEPTRMRLAWLDDVPMLNAPVLTDTIPAGGNGWTVEKIVFVQADVIAEQGIVEAEWVTSLAAQDARIRAIVAFAPLEKGADQTRAWLDRLKVLPMVRGVRRLIQSEAAGFATQPDFIAGVKVLADYGYTFDIGVRHHQLRDALALAQACPEIQFVLDHAGKPDIRNKSIDLWRADLSAIAALPNVRCKLSGLVTEADLLNWTPVDLQPYIDHMIAAFGADRLMFGSDSPVFRMAGTTYAAWVDVALGSMKALSEADKQKIFAANAAAFYRI
ncbi:MAG: amidohydrolase family protein [bacterium]|nr:amidohydrolase family protein [bacterium]